MPGAVGSRDTAGKTWNALVPELHAPVRRRDPPAGAAARSPTLPPGEVLAAGTGLPSLVEQIAWLRPRRPRVRAEQVAWARHGGRRARASSGSAGWRRTPRALVAGDGAARREGAGRPAARAGRPRAAAGRPDRGRPRAAGVDAGAAPAAGRRRRVARRRDDVPVHPGLGAPRARHRVDGGGAARLPRLGLAHAGAAAADLPRRRHRPHLRHRPGRARRVVPARRRRGRAQPSCCTTPGPPGWACAGSRPTVLVSTSPARRAAPAAARPRRRAGGRGRGRHAVRVLRPEARRARTPRDRRPGAAQAARAAVRVSAGGHRRARRRPGRLRRPRRHRRPRSPPRGR